MRLSLGHAEIGATVWIGTNQDCSHEQYLHPASFKLISIDNEIATMGDAGIAGHYKVPVNKVFMSYAACAEAYPYDYD